MMSGVAESHMRSPSLVETAITYRDSPNNSHTSQIIPHNTSTKPLTNGLAVHTHCALVPAFPRNQPIVSAPEQQIKTETNFVNTHPPIQDATVIAQRPLPTLLRYIDNDLMRSASKHNHPPDPKAICTICYYPWDTPINCFQAGLNGQAPVHTKFLPLSPCGHWVHYRCLIWLATKDVSHRDKCSTCGTQLFHWEGITTLTLATRTGLSMSSSTTNSSTPFSDNIAYDKDCATITSIIHATFFTHLSLLSPHADRSPDLVQCFYDVLDALERMGLPRARWLRYETPTGHLLWGALVAIKMRRYLVEGHAGIVETEGKLT